MRTLLAIVFAASCLAAQPPEYIWYDFNASGATNLAVPGVGNGTPDPSLMWPNQLCLGDIAVSSPGAAATTQIDTGWPLTLGSGDWSVGMWLDLRAGGGTSNYFQYLFGCNSAGSFRCFVDGAAGNGNIILRGPVQDTIITGGGDQTRPVHVCWVYDSSVPEVRGYLDGVLNVTVPQSPLNINGTGNFTVMRYDASSSSAQSGVIMDDFRFYSRAIDAPGVGVGSELWIWVNACTSTAPPPPSYQVNQPDLSMDVDGVTGSPYGPANVPMNVGGSYTVNLSSAIPSLPLDIAVSPSTAMPDALVLPGSGQRFNLDPLASSTLFVSGLTFPPMPAGSLSVPVSPASAGTLTTQAVGLDPGRAEGIVLSQASELVIVADMQLNPSFGCVNSGSPLGLVDDSFQQQALGFSFSFYGASYSEIYVGSNGHCTFGSGNSGWASGSTGLSSNRQPIIAPCSEDFNPGAGGQVTLFTDAPTQTFEVCWSGVPSFGSTNSNTFSVLASSGTLITFDYAQLQETGGTVGLGAGNSANSPFAVNFSRAGGVNGPITVPPGMDPTEEFAGNNDLSGFQINFLTDTMGVPQLIF